MHKAFIYRLYPTEKQAEQLAWVLDRCRELYNAALEEWREAYRMAGKGLGYCDQARELPGLREACPAYKHVGSQVLQKDLGDRWHDCPRCHLSLPRDHVSAMV